MLAIPTAAHLSPEEDAAWRGLVRMQALLGAHLTRELAPQSDLSLADYTVLATLGGQPAGRLRAAELGHALGWEKSRLSHHVARMQARGLVVRQPCASDRRGQYVAITSMGRRTLVTATPAYVATVRHLFVDRLSSAQVAALADATDAVLSTLHTTGGGGDEP